MYIRATQADSDPTMVPVDVAESNSGAKRPAKLPFQDIGLSLDVDMGTYVVAYNFIFDLN